MLRQPPLPLMPLQPPTLPLPPLLLEPRCDTVAVREAGGEREALLEAVPLAVTPPPAPPVRDTPPDGVGCTALCVGVAAALALALAAPCVPLALLQAHGVALALALLQALPECSASVALPWALSLPAGLRVALRGALALGRPLPLASPGVAVPSRAVTLPQALALAAEVLLTLPQPPLLLPEGEVEPEAWLAVPPALALGSPALGVAVAQPEALALGRPTVLVGEALPEALAQLLPVPPLLLLALLLPSAVPELLEEAVELPVAVLLGLPPPQTPLPTMLGVSPLLAQALTLQGGSQCSPSPSSYCPQTLRQRA